MTVKVLGLDTGFANVGWTIAEMTKSVDAWGGIKIIAMGHLETKGASKKLNVKSADDNFERARTIARELVRVMDEHAPNIVCAEALSFVPSSQAMCKVGMCFGIIATLVASYDVPFLQASPKEIKHAVTGKAQASKVEIQNAIDEGFQNVPADIFDEVKLAQGKREHPYDSLGAIIACWESDPMRMARQMA